MESDILGNVAKDSLEEARQLRTIGGTEMAVWKFKSCTKCGGDLFAQDGDWGCLQCGSYYYPNVIESLEVPPLDATDLTQADGARGRRRRAGGLAGRNINAIIRAQVAGTQRWMARNQRVIACLDEGRTVAETATLVGKDRRRVRSVAETLQDMRVLAPD